MVDATTTNLGATTTESSSLTTSTIYRCTSCQVTFNDSQEQRAHMKEPWHVYNVKRKIASLPPIPFEAFKTKIQVRENSPPNQEDKQHESEPSGESDNDSEGSVSSLDCLFCSDSFDNGDDGLQQNLNHMTTVHGLYIPDQESVDDLESLISYLATEVRVWHECLYCGATKPTTQSIQSHMRDKGHCQLNLDREPELLDFWEAPVSSSDDDQIAKERNLADTEMRFASGKVVTSRRAGPGGRKPTRKRNMMALTTTAPEQTLENEETPPPTTHQSAPGRQLAKREEMGIIGISMQQRHALVLAEKKAQRSELVARRAREWVNARGANFQKYDQIDTTGFKGKQNHKLQPR